MEPCLQVPNIPDYISKFNKVFISPFMGEIIDDKICKTIADVYSDDEIIFYICDINGNIVAIDPTETFIIDIPKDIWKAKKLIEKIIGKKIDLVF